MRLDFSDFTVLVMVSEIYHALNFTITHTLPSFRTVFPFGILDEYLHHSNTSAATAALAGIVIIQA